MLWSNSIDCIDCADVHRVARGSLANALLCARGIRVEGSRRFACELLNCSKKLSIGTREAKLLRKTVFELI